MHSSEGNPKPGPAADRGLDVRAMQGYIRHHYRMAAEFAELVRGDGRFQLSAPPRFGLVCFHAKVRQRQLRHHIISPPPLANVCLAGAIGKANAATRQSDKIVTGALQRTLHSVALRDTLAVPCSCASRGELRLCALPATRGDCNNVIALLRPHVRVACERQGVPRETNAALLEAVNASGKAFLIHTELGQGDAKQFMIRMAIGATNTQVPRASMVVSESVRHSKHIRARSSQTCISACSSCMTR